MPRNELSAGLRDAATGYAKQRRDGIGEKLRAAMKLIDSEIEPNHGIYPHNGGKLNQRELCRRAGVFFTTLHSPAHKDSTRLEIQEWLETKKTRTKQETHKEVAQRVNFWKGEHGKVATQIAIYELELNERDVEIRQLKEHHQALREEHDILIRRLREENAALQEQLSLRVTGNVTSLRPKGRK